MPETPGTVVYVSNAGSKEIFVFAMDGDSGALDPIERVAVPGTAEPSPTSIPMAISPNRRFLYAALRSAPFPVSSFAIDPASGRLTLLGTAALAASMAYIVTDRTGRFLLGASYPGNKLAINPIDGAGRLVEKPTQIVMDRPKAHCVIVDASNRFAYCTNLGADVIMQLRFDAQTGTVASNDPATVSTKADAGPRHLALHPSGRFLYLLERDRCDDRHLRRRSGCRHVDRAADPTDPAPRLRRQALGGRSARHPRRAFRLCQRTLHQHADRLPHRPRARHPLENRPLADRNDAARLCHRPARPVSASPPGSPRTR